LAAARGAPGGILPAGMRLYDGQTGKLREIEIRPRMTVYVCGITPYDSAHLGHAFTYTHFDVLVRYLGHQGVDLVHAQNVTDVDDDILRVAKERGVDFLELAQREVKAFEEQMRAIGIKPPTFSPRATEFVPAMVEEVQALLAGGHAYERNGTVYFRVESDPGYGRLSHLTRDEMLALAAERGGHPEDPNKDDPLDFVLWQAWRPGEPWWESPWGKGRPGWHIECSTMARRLLGQPVDIHGGGSDLIFPHHESELAQAEALPGERPFVRHWVHTGTVYMAREKMSKSLGNLAFVGDLLERHGPLALRRHLLRRHYRQDWEFDENELAPAAAPPVEGRSDRASFFEAMDHDLDTPSALAILDRAATSSARADRDWMDEGRSILGLDL
jgi:L-cysteine:1D-myo-inositol 2-amino-2-deoxy-alpha-D-glucopyranoside ligase